MELNQSIQRPSEPSIDSKSGSVSQNKSFVGRLVLIRGPPGVGKSYYAKSSLEKQHNKGVGCIWYETDQFFTDPMTEQYLFNPKQLINAHLWCQRMTKMAMKKKIDVILVANTFSWWWELRPYLSLAKKMGYKIWIEDLYLNQFTPHELSKRCIHNVSLKTIENIIQRAQPVGTGWISSTENSPIYRCIKEACATI